MKKIIGRIIAALILCGLAVRGIIAFFGDKEDAFTQTGTITTGIVTTPVTPEKTGFSATLNFPEQAKMPGNYSGNTAIMRAYVNAHKQTVTIPADATQGTMTIRTSMEPVVRHNTVTLYANVPTLMKTMKWMRLNLAKATLNGNEYQFDLTDVAVIYGKTGFSFNMLKEMAGKEISISTFVGERNNRVESITFTAE